MLNEEKWWASSCSSCGQEKIRRAPWFSLQQPGEEVALRSPILDWLRQKLLDTGKQSLDSHTRESHIHLVQAKLSECMCVTEMGGQEGMVQ